MMSAIEGVEVGTISFGFEGPQKHGAELGSDI
jgi:hypothetical protein